MAVHVCGLLLMLCTPFGATIPLSSFYSYGSAVDDFLLPMSDDGSSSAIPLPAPFLFFGGSYTTIFVSLRISETAVCVYSIVGSEAKSHLNALKSICNLYSVPKLLLFQCN